MDDLYFLDMFGKFCNSMQSELPTARIDHYAEVLRPFNEKILSQALHEWALNHPPKFMPSPNDIHISCIEITHRENRKGGPQTVQDLFGNKVRVETPLAREFRRILKAFLGHPVYRGQEMLYTGVITHREAMEMVDEAEAKYGPARGEDVPVNIAKGYKIDWEYS